MMTHVGTSGNVFAYNFSAAREPQRLCDISLHGHYSNANLFESNVVEEIDISDYWGPIGPHNTFLRNVITQEGVDVKDSSHGQNLVGNVLKRGRINVNSSVNETVLHGNVINGTTQWDDNINDQNIPVSYFLSEKPDFFEDSPWPLFGPDVDAEHKLPAQVRYESGNPITHVQNDIVQTPLDFDLSVYPNPFNPQTTILVDLPKTDKVRLEVYSLTGRLVDVLVDEMMPAGKQAVCFQPSALSASGIYVVRLSVGSEIMDKKITLLK